MEILDQNKTKLKKNKSESESQVVVMKDYIFVTLEIHS